MARHNLHFSDKEAAQNWAENYGGKFHDNTHTRGWKGRGTNYTVTEEFDDNDCDDDDWQDHRITEEFPHGVIVYHWKWGKGVVKYRYRCDRHNGNFIVWWENRSLDGYYSADDSLALEMLSFTPYDLVDGGYSRDLKHRVITP